MPQKTEYAAQPPVFEVVRSGLSGAIIWLRENIAQLGTDPEENERWEADEYELRVPWNSELPARVGTNFAAWMAKAKAAAAAQKPPSLEKRVDEVEQVTGTIIDTLGQILEG